MSGLNRYYRRSHIAEKRFRLLIRYFAMDLRASQTALLSGISRRTVNSIFLKIRVRLFAACQAAAPFGSSEVEADAFDKCQKTIAKVQRRLERNFLSALERVPMAI
jgi:transposase